MGPSQGVRRARDPIEHMRTLILEHEFAEPGDLKRMEKEIKKVRVTQGPREVYADQDKQKRSTLPAR